MNIALLLHTFNRYQFAWGGCLDGYSKYFNWNLPMYWGTDTNDHAKYNFGNFKLLYSGDGEWSDRLISLLKQLDYEYIVYTQEDFWPVKPPPDYNEMIGYVEKLNLWRLQISTKIHFYSLEGDTPPFFFKNFHKSKYILSHQFSIWNRKFLLECLISGENPWQNEYHGSLRLNKRTDLAQKIAIYPSDWYYHAVENGKLITT